MSVMYESRIEILVNSNLTEHCRMLGCLLSRKRTAGTKTVHKIRVLCRRISEVLKVSEVHLSIRKLRRRRMDIKRFAASLGPLRDVDVHIDYVRHFIKNIPEDERTVLYAGPERILHRLKQDRKLLKRKADEGMKRFMRSKTMSDFVCVYADMECGDAVSLETEAACGLWEDCRSHLWRRAAKMAACEDCLFNPSDIEALHKMRIACKKLRYTADIYQKVFPHKLGHILTVLEKFQTLLGSIHDCDVWDDYIDKFVKDEKRLTLEYCGHLDDFAKMKPGFDHFRQHIRRERKVLFSQYKQMWQKSAEKKVWDKFVAAIEPESDATQ